MKRIFAIASAVGLVTALSACGNDSESFTPIYSERGTTNSIVIITDWGTLPSGNKDLPDIYIRTVKIDNLCYIQTQGASVKTSSLTAIIKPC